MTTTADRHLHVVDEDTHTSRVMAESAAERTLLGMCMSSGQAVEETADILSGRDFYQPVHATIWTALLALWADSQPVEPMAVARLLEESGDLARVGGAPYLFGCVEQVPTAAGTPAYYARIVRDWSKRRTIAESGMRLVQGAKNLQIPVDALVDSAQKDIHQAVVGLGQPNLSAVGDLIDGELDHLAALVAGEVPRGLSTGLGVLDDLIGGWHPGQLIIPAGRPGMGKSVAGLGFARAAARRGVPALVFSLEMSKREVLHRLISDVAQVNLYRLTSGNLDQDDLAKARGARDEIASWPLHVDTEARTVAQIRSVARRFRQRHGALGLIVVDYLQLLDSTIKADRRDLEIGEHSKSLKVLAGELETTVIAAAQLNRKNEERGDKRPQLSDLRDSGSLEQDADVVILLHRDDYYDKEHARAGECDFIVAKHRNGPTDTVTVAAQLHYSRFADYGIA